MFLYPRAVFNVIKRRRILKFTDDKLRQMQLKKFRELVKFANQNSPYYAEIISRLKIDIATSRPEDFPVMNKEILLENFDRIVTNPDITLGKIKFFLEKSKDPAELYLNKYIVIHSSGSSGLVGYFVYTVNEFLKGINTFNTRGNRSRFFNKMAYVGAIDGHYAGASIASFMKHFFPKCTECRLFDIGLPFEEIVKQMNTFKPVEVSGYAFGLKKLAEYQKAGKLNIKPRRITSSGEPLSHEDKMCIESVFNVPVKIVYASSETLVAGVQELLSDGMYLMEDNIYFEIEGGKVLVTNLFNYTLPLIRYEMADELMPINKSPGDISFAKIKGVVGREEATPYFLNDSSQTDFISPIIVAEFFVKGLQQFQMRIVDERNFEFLIVFDKDLNEAEKEKVKQNIISKWRDILHKKQMTNVRFKLSETEELEVNPKTGKFNLIRIED